MNDTLARTVQSIYPAVRYEDAKAGIAWLESALGFEEHVVYANEDGSIAHAELKLAGNLIMLGSVKDDGYGVSPKSAGLVTATVYVALESPAAIDALYSRAKAAGAQILRELCDTDYGSHDFTVRDPEGHVWSFGTYRPQSQ